jgi:hypothetical protein
VKVKVSEATEIQLDWMACEAAGMFDAYPKYGEGRKFLQMHRGNSAAYVHPTTDWAQGGPIIEREWLHVEPWPNASVEERRWSCTQYELPVPIGTLGPTPLIAAMRCFVASELGETVEVPEELS